LASPRRRQALVLLALAAIVALGAAVRIFVGLHDPNFDARDAKGLLKSDPGLLHYVTARIVEARGLPPADFRADPRLEHPELTDFAAIETPGQEFVVAWCQLLFGGETPLHVTVLWVMGIFASLTAAAVFGMARELTTSSAWALLAALLYAVLPVNYRTAGVGLIREDFSLPWFALHLWLALRAARLGTPASFALAGAAAGLAAATWHAMGFVLGIEAACLLAWFLRSGQNPFATPRSWILLATLAVFALAVPVLREKQFLLSLPMQIALALLAEALLARRWPLGKLAQGLAVLAVWGALLALGLTLARASGGGLADYSHVYAMMKDKIVRLGVLPADPRELSFESRLLWSGPFQTGTWRDLTQGETFGAALLAVALFVFAPGWLRGRGDARELLVVLFALAASVAAWLVQRLFVLPGMVTPVVAALVLRRARPRSLGWGLMSAGVLGQAAYVAILSAGYVNPWYWPPQRIAELARTIDAVEAHVPAGEAVAADFVNSTAILAHTRRPIVLQPKYETVRSRRRSEAFLTTFFHGTPEDLRALLASWRCRYLLVDRGLLWYTFGYAAGVPGTQDRPSPGTAAEVLMSSDARVLESVPGYRLLYRSSREFDVFRLFALE